MAVKQSMSMRRVIRFFIFVGVLTKLPCKEVAYRVTSGLSGGEDEARLTLLYHIIENQTIKALTVFRFVKLHAQVATQHRDL